MLLAVIVLFLAGTSAEIFTNTFLVKMRQPAERHVADHVADRNGFVNLGPVSRHLYLFLKMIKLGSAHTVAAPIDDFGVHHTLFYFTFPG